MESFTEITVKILRAIPEGRVATYGQVARLAGNPRGARQVSRVLHSMSAKHQLPWHRVVNAKGEIVIGDPEAAYTQKVLLEDEGIQLIAGKRVDLERYQWEMEGE